MGMFTKAIEEIRHSSPFSVKTMGTTAAIGIGAGAAAGYNEDGYKSSTGLSVMTASLTAGTVAAIGAAGIREGIILSGRDASGITKFAKSYNSFKEGLQNKGNYDWKLGTKDAIVGGAVAAGGGIGYAIGGDTESTANGAFVGAAVGLHGVMYKGMSKNTTNLGMAGAAVTSGLGFAAIGAVAGLAEGEGNTLSYAATFGAIGLSGLPFKRRIASNGTTVEAPLYSGIGGKIGMFPGLLYGFAGSDKNGEHRTFDWGKATIGATIGGKIGSAAGLFPARFRPNGRIGMGFADLGF